MNLPKKTAILCGQRLSLTVAAVLVSCVSSIALCASSLTLEDEFNRLKKTGIDFNNFGQVCEAVAEHEFEAAFPSSKYEIVNGIAYGDSDGTLGELDVVVFEKSNQLVVAIGEVKCWRDAHSALTKALEQKTRYQRALKSQEPLFFKGLVDNRDFDDVQFASPQDFKTVGPKGAVVEGFDLELPYTLNELMDLRERLIKCKASKRCK